MPFYFNVLDAFYFVRAQSLLLRKWWRTMSLIQFLLLAIAGISLVLASDLVRASYQSRKRQQVDVMPGWRGGGTFGKVATSGVDALRRGSSTPRGSTQPYPHQGRSRSKLLWC